MKNNTAEMMVEHFGEPEWAVDEISDRMRRAKTPQARARLQAVIDEVWSEYEGGPVDEEAMAADCWARTEYRLEGPHD
jgi:hypothetical protein